MMTFLLELLSDTLAAEARGFTAGDGGKPGQGPHLPSCIFLT
jgi:hypothetical protein